MGLISPLTLTGKQIYRDVCETKKPWDTPLSCELKKRWEKWEEQLPCEQLVPRPIVHYEEEIEDIELHSFGDASLSEVGAAVYVVVPENSGTTHQLVAAKGRLAKQGLTVPRLELVAAHMATNLLVNVRNALDNVPSPKLYGWLDSTVALHWIKGNGQYKQFVANRVAKIQLHKEIEWRYVPTSVNPADLASRGAQVRNCQLWWTGPEWLSNPHQWPENPVTEKTAASEAEAKMIREVVSLAKDQKKPNSNVFEDLLDHFDLRRALRIQAWVQRFTTNRDRRGPLTSEDLQGVRNWWIKRVQSQDSHRPHFKETCRVLNLQPNADGLLECHGRIQGNYPIYLPTDSTFTRKLVQRIHVETLHGGVTLTMAAVREKYWVPTLRRVVKSVRSACWGCKRFRATPLAVPTPGLLPNDRTTGGTAFEVIGTDYAGPILYQLTPNRKGKAYLIIFSCSLSRAIHLELVPNMEANMFLLSLKRFIARRGRPRVIYSDNGSQFVKAAAWLRQVRKDEQLQGFLESHEIKWKFNLSRAPWWGGQFERLIGVVKQALYKTIGAATLKWDELLEVILDIETQVNRRPLSYEEEDVQMATLTPSAFLFQRSNTLPEAEPWRSENKGLRKRAKFLKTCKDALWARWSKEYLAALRERHNLALGTNSHLRIGDVVFIATGGNSP